jgi:hypothetical protein
MQARDAIFVYYVIVELQLCLEHGTYDLVDRSLHFSETCCFCLQGRRGLLLQFGNSIFLENSGVCQLNFAVSHHRRQ